jgi:hypothetical protein
MLFVMLCIVIFVVVRECLEWGPLKLMSNCRHRWWMHGKYASWPHLMRREHLTDAGATCVERWGHTSWLIITITKTSILARFRNHFPRRNTA